MTDKKVRKLKTNSTPMRFFLSRQIFVTVFCFALLLFSNAENASSQTFDFQQTGQIRPIVSKTDSVIPSWKNTIHDAGIEFSGVIGSKIEYYFTYKIVENRAISEKWITLSEDRAWN